MKTKPLIPPDRERCQAERLSGSFMTLGPRHMERCGAKPTVIVTERAPGKDGQRGSMSLCPHCLAIFRSKFPPEYAVIQLIEEEACNTSSDSSAAPQGASTQQRRSGTRRSSKPRTKKRRR